MVRLSQGEMDEKGPPFTVVDGRDERAVALDEVVGAWAQAHPAPEVKRPSELRRGDGLQLTHKFGIAVCIGRQGVRRSSSRFVPRSSAGICGYLIVVKNGEKLPRCKGCGRRTWARNEEVIFQHDDPRVIKSTIQDFRGWRGRHPRAMVSPALFNGWARRTEKKLEMERFYAYLPWNLPNFGVKL